MITLKLNVYDVSKTQCEEAHLSPTNNNFEPFLIDTFLIDYISKYTFIYIKMSIKMSNN